MKFSHQEECYYGRLYREQKEKYANNNENGMYAERTASILAEKKWDKDTDAYKHLTAGKLPPAQIDATARRWAVKLWGGEVHCDQTVEQRAMWPSEERPHSIAHWLRRSWRFDARVFRR